MYEMGYIHISEPERLPLLSVFLNLRNILVMHSLDLLLLTLLLQLLSGLVLHPILMHLLLSHLLLLEHLALERRGQISKVECAPFLILNYISLTFLVILGVT